MKILFLTNVPSPYRVNFFNELGRFCDLTVLFEKDTSAERDDSWKNYKFERFKGIFLSGKSTDVDSAFCPGVVKYLKKGAFDKIVLTNISTPTTMLAVEHLRLHKMPYYLEIDGGAPKSGGGIKEKIKKHFIRGAVGYFSPAKAGDAYCTAYGAMPDRLHRYPFTSLYASDLLAAPLPKGEKLTLRKKLGLSEEKILISVGRFSYLGGYGKGYDTLLTVAENLPGTIGVYIIGDEPTEEFVRWKEEKHLSHVHYLPFKQKEDLFAYYRAADLSVLLTRGDVWGLVVNEAMANALPVITTDACVAGLELIDEGKTGYIVPVNDPEAAREKILACLTDEEKQSALPPACLEKIRGYTFEEMARVHMEVFSK